MPTPLTGALLPDYAVVALARNTLGILEHTALSSLGRRAAIDFDGRSQSFAELHDRSVRLANGLALTPLPEIMEVQGRLF